MGYIYVTSNMYTLYILECVCYDGRKEVVHMQTAHSATGVRQNWGRFIDSVVHTRPAFVQRNRDRIAAMSIPDLKTVLKPYSFHLDYDREEDGSVSGSLREIDLVANAPTLDELKLALAGELMEYADEYLDEYQTYSTTPNRSAHVPYVLRVIVEGHEASVARLIHA